MYLKSEYQRFHHALSRTLIPCGILTVLLFVLFFSLLSGEQTLSLSYWFASLPQSFRSFYFILANLDMSDPVVFFARFFQPVYFLLCLAAGIIGSRCLNADERGLGELWYTMPYSRTSVFLRRFLCGIAALAAINILLLGITLLCYTVLFIPNLTYVTIYAVIFLRMAVVEGVFYAIGVLYSACFHRPLHGSLLSAATLLFLWGIALIPAFSGHAEFLMYAALPYYGIPEFALQAGPFYSIGEGITLSSVFAAGTAAALLLYRRKQFYLFA